jgi:hypothetical protein
MLRFLLPVTVLAAVLVAAGCGGSGISGPAETPWRLRCKADRRVRSRSA